MPEGGEGLPEAAAGLSGRFLSGKDEKRLPKMDPSIRASSDGIECVRSGGTRDEEVALAGDSNKSLASPATRTRNWAKSNTGRTEAVLVGDGVVVVVVVVEFKLLVFFDNPPAPMENLTVNSGGRRGAGGEVMLNRGLDMTINPLERLLEFDLDKGM